MENRRDEKITPFGVDWTVVLIYLALVFIGWINIYAAVYDDTHTNILDITQRYGMQAVWIGISLFIAIFVLLVDDKYYHILAYPLFGVTIILLLGTFVFGKEVHGARLWYEFGPIRIQPVEFLKVTSSLALARIMSGYSFNIHNIRSVGMAFMILLIPVSIIILQNDTGSALVYVALGLMLFREGLNGWLYVAIFSMLALFVLSFWLEPITLLMILIVACVAGEGLVNRRWKNSIIYLSSVSLGAFFIYFATKLLGLDWGSYTAILISVVLSLVGIILYIYRTRLTNIYLFVILFFGSLAFTHTIDYVFDNVMQIHQQKRVLDLLGIESDVKKWGYNVNQSKIAIGSGGFTGKGFLEGTQTKYNFVPEQSTDFIFCTVGEEWGFVGSAVVVILFSMLIIKLIVMGERQHETFGRVYCYCAASIFFFHLFVNIGMTIGLMPVIGIPLPFFSYGGSSLIAFTILLFIAIKLDSSKNQHITHI